MEMGLFLQQLVVLVLLTQRPDGITMGNRLYLKAIKVINSTLGQDSKALLKYLGLETIITNELLQFLK